MDPTALVVQILGDAFPGVRVSTEVPFDRPADRLVVVTMENAGRGEFLWRSAFGITCWGTSDRDAFSMALAAVDALTEEAETHPYLSAVEAETITRDEWTANGQARYYARVTLYINTDE